MPEESTDYRRGFDSNAREKRELMEELAECLAKKSEVHQDEALKALQESPLVDITEYGRSVHAEMEALLNCSRNGISTRGATLYSTTFPCHNCAKHLVAAGIVRVVYVEPYPKSKALKLHKDSISIDPADSKERLILEPFVGVGPRRFFDLYSMRLGLGSQLIRKDDLGNKIRWQEKDAEPRITLSPAGCIELEKAASNDFKLKVQNLETLLGKPLEEAKESDYARLNET